MLQEIITMLQTIIAVIVGGLIGLAFGCIQDVARRQNEKRQADGKINNIWSLMPGSGTRVAYLLIALVLIQLICPMLFKDGTQWWVSGGLVGGYGVMLFLQLRRRKAREI